MVLISEGEEHAKDDGDQDVATGARPRDPIQESRAQQAQDRELRGMPPLDDEEPAITPEHDEPPKRCIVREDMGREPGEELVRADDGTRRPHDEQTPAEERDDPKPSHRTFPIERNRRQPMGEAGTSLSTPVRRSSWQVESH